ncbi:MAG: restriction endonuclease subunit S [Candidatus Heimdallarchaeota archaeon]|nr:restriction endonuclease subunit S [Candidatus Heimdallarchaeota archaeon]MCK4610442.1 restriction endonuclease subunit S [Candidatus Heimdallarchaeota archaeon]
MKSLDQHFSSENEILENDVSSWKFHRLDDFLDIPPRNGIYKSTDFYGRGTKIIKLGTVFEHSRISNQEMERLELTEREKESYLLKTGDLVFCRTSIKLEGVGKCIIVETTDEEIVFESNTFRIRLDKTRINPEYIYYYFQSSYGKAAIKEIAMRTAATSIRARDLTNLEIKLPTHKYQITISTILNEIDSKIKLNQKINLTLESLAHSLFHSWFVHFDPFQEGEFVDSELGSIPKGWNIAQIKDICLDIFNGGTPYRKEPKYWIDGDIKWIKSQELLDTIIIDSEERINEIGLKNSAAKLFGKNTILIALYGATVGQLGIVRTEATANQACTAIITDNNKSKPFMVFYSLLNKRGFLKSISSGAAQQNISKKIIEDFKLLSPPIEILDSISTYFNFIWNKIENNIRENFLLSSLRDLLLPQLLSGKLKINNPQQFLEKIGKFN